MSGIFSYCHPPINLLSNFDKELQEFFKNVLIKWEEYVPKNPKQFNEVLRSITSNESSVGKKLCFNDPLQRIAYLFRFSPCYTSAVANHFLRLVKKNPMILKDAMWRRQVNICCLGGGPGTEVVALSKILSSAQDCFWQATKKPLHLQVTVVDKNRHWKREAIRVLQTLKSSSEIFDEGKMEISFRFLVADLTFSGDLEESVFEALRDADIITMVKFLSVLKKPFNKVSFLMKEIANSMKKDSVLFYLDTGITKAYHPYYEFLKHYSGIQCIYGPKELEVFTLTAPSLRHNVKLFYKTFHKNICLTSTVINSCAWKKVDDLEKQKAACHSEIRKSVLEIRQRRIKWQKKAIESQEKLLSFHRKLRHVFPKKGQVFWNSPIDSLDAYPLVPKNTLFSNKSKDRRIYICDFELQVKTSSRKSNKKNNKIK